MGRAVHRPLRTAATGGWAALLTTLALLPAAPGAAWAAGGTDGGATDGSVRHAPHGSITVPADGATYRLGDPVALHAVASDPDGPLAPDAIHWTVVRHTGAAAETVAEASGPDASFTPDTEHGAGTTYEVRLAVVDDCGLASTQSITIGPRPVTVTLRSTPDGAPLTVDGLTAPAPRSISAVAGQHLRIGATDSFTPAGGDGVVLDGWSDGGAPSHEVVAGDDGLDLTAGYRAPRMSIGDAYVQASPSGDVGASAAGISEGAVAERRLPSLRFSAPDPFGTRVLSGSLTAGPSGGRVEIAVRRGSARRAGCGWWIARNARFTRAARSACGRPRWIPAAMRRTRSGERWIARLGGSLPAGSYAFVVRVLDGDGHPVDFQKG